MKVGGEIIKLNYKNTLEEDFLFFLENSKIVNVLDDSRSAFQLILELNDDINSPYLQMNSETIYSEGTKMLEVKRIFLKLVIIQKNNNTLRENRLYKKFIETNNSFQSEIFTHVDIINKTNEFMSSVTPAIVYYKIFDPIAETELSRIFIEKLNVFFNSDTSDDSNNTELLLKLFADNNYYIGIIGMELLPDKFQSITNKNKFQLASAIYEVIRTAIVGYIHMDAHIHNIKWINDCKHYYRGDDGSVINGRVILIDWGIVAKLNVSANIDKLKELFSNEINSTNVLECYNFYKKLAIINMFSTDCQPLVVDMEEDSELLQELVNVFKYRKNEEEYLMDNDNPENEFYKTWNNIYRTKLTPLTNLSLDPKLLEWPNKDTDISLPLLKSLSMDSFDDEDDDRRAPPRFDPNFVYVKSRSSTEDTSGSNGGRRKRTNKIRHRKKVKRTRRR